MKTGIPIKGKRCLSAEHNFQWRCCLIQNISSFVCSVSLCQRRSLSNANSNEPQQVERERHVISLKMFNVPFIVSKHRFNALFKRQPRENTSEFLWPNASTLDKQMSYFLHSIQQFGMSRRRRIFGGSRVLTASFLR